MGTIAPRLRGVRGGARGQSVMRTHLYPRQRYVRMGRRSGAGHRMERAWRCDSARSIRGPVAAFHALALGHFHRGRYEEAARAARKAVQPNPAHSISHMLLVAPLAKLGRLKEAEVAAARVLELQPAFATAGNFRASIARPPLPHPWARRCTPPACRNSITANEPSHAGAAPGATICTIHVSGPAASLKPGP